jgi:hypothetical protein
MVSVAEPDHLKSEGFFSKVGRIPKGNIEINLPKGQGSLSWYDTMEGRSSQAKLGQTDLHGVNGFGVHDVVAAASIHQYLGGPCVANDGVNNQRILTWLRDTIQVVVMVKNDGDPDQSRKARVAGSAACTSWCSSLCRCLES